MSLTHGDTQIHHESFMYRKYARDLTHSRSAVSQGRVQSVFWWGARGTNSKPGAGAPKIDKNEGWTNLSLQS